MFEVTKIHKIEDLHRIFQEYLANVLKAQELEDLRLEEREKEKKRIREKTAAKLDPVAAKLYLALRESGVTFDGENGHAMLSMDRNAWRELEAYLKEVEND